MKLLFVSLGCDKNLVDSEHMLGMLCADGLEITDDEKQADIIIVNSCCFIHDAMEESIENIIELAKYKETGSLKALIVTGCLAQRYAGEIEKEIPEVDAIIGTNSYDEVVAAIHKALEGQKSTICKSLEGLPQDRNGRVLTTGGHFAYLKIAEGCDKHCTYCVIPQIRGNFRSVPKENLLAEARQLAEDGVKELIIVAQESTLYGVDLYGKKALPELLDELNEISGIQWIRLLYCYPEEINDELIDAMVRNEKVCHYIDMPIQHANNEILGRMGRKTSKEDIVTIVKRLREKMNDIVIRTTLICGFPGETQENHEELMEFINDMEFDRLGAFAYSPEEGTPAINFDNQVDEEVKSDWVDEVMELQQEVSLDKNQTVIGQELWAFVEGKVADENAYVARTYRDAPGVDGYIFISGEDATLITGDFVKVKVTGAYEYDLIGEIL